MKDHGILCWRCGARVITGRESCPGCGAALLPTSAHSNVDMNSEDRETTFDIPQPVGVSTTIASENHTTESRGSFFEKPGVQGAVILLSISMVLSTLAYLAAHDRLATLSSLAVLASAWPLRHLKWWLLLYLPLAYMVVLLGSVVLALIIVG